MSRGTSLLVKDESAALISFLDKLTKFGYLKKEEVFQLRKKYYTIEDLYVALLESNVVPQDKLAKLFAESINVPYIDLKSIDEKAYTLIDEQNAVKYGFVPFSLDERSRILQVALLNPAKFSKINQSAITFLEKKLGLRIEFFVASAVNAIDRIQKQQNPQKVEQPSNEKVITEKKILNLLYMKPIPIKFEPNKIDEKILRKIPLNIAQKYKSVIFRQGGDGSLDVAVSDINLPGLREVFEFVQNKTGVKLNLIQADQADVENAINRYKALVANSDIKQQDLPQNKDIQQDDKKSKQDDKSHKVSEKSILDVSSNTNTDTSLKLNEVSQSVVKNSSSMEEPDLVKFLNKDKISVDDIKLFVNSGQVPQAVASILFLAVTSRASDIHIEPYEKAVRVRYRIDGELNEVILLPATLNAGVVARIKILSKLKIDEQRVPQDGRIEVIVNGEAIDVRISTLPTVFGEKVVMRLLSKSKKLQDLAELGLDGLGYDRISKAMNKPYGVILATGPTGSGKSTSLYAILTKLNKPQTNIVTLEDPVEYDIQGINQVQVKPQIGFGFAEGLRSVLRQDPNVVMVGEIRDKETAELVTQAALTGHLVLSTLHTNNSAGALPRMTNLGVEPFLLTSAINAVIGQRLVRRICPKCREEVSVPQSMMYEVKRQFEKINFSHPLKFYRGRGCSECKNGFKGRVGIYEVLEMSETIENLVLDRKSAEEVFAQATKEGMITMRQDGMIKAVKGLTTVDEVLRATSETKEG
jgi:type II secretory ATPase GspE/PulE/Tfp pilus assembly ATPase PilB-like protein